MISRKHAIIAIVAAVAALFQISIMSGLVREKRFEFQKTESVSVGKFIRVKKFRRDPRENPLETPEKQDPPPRDPEIDTTLAEPEILEAEQIDISAINPATGVSLFGFSFSDGDYLPIVKVPADYPRAALRKGIEGWALVSFTISKTGAVKDPFIVKAQPPGFFERSALRAVKKFKYKPKIVGGEAVEVQGVTNKMVFKLEGTN